MPTPIGSRVGAILGADEDVVKFLGYGVYEGDEVPDENAVGFGPILREMKRPNPKIKLDSGKVVWGCECWWGPEEATKKKLERYANVVETDIDEARRQTKAPSN